MTHTNSLPILAAYYRSWRDAYSDPANFGHFSDLPDAVDIAMIFPNDEVQQGFWDHLPETVKTLMQKGIKVARTLFVDALVKPGFQLAEDEAPLPDFSLDETGAVERAAALLDRYANVDGITGIVIDVDHDLTADQAKYAAMVWDALLTQLQARIGKDQAFMVFDHDILTEFSPLFPLVAKSVLYAFVDCYGMTKAQIDQRWQDYAPYITPDKFVPGFSFYEERGERWHDVEKGFESSNAKKLVDWQPDAGNKGGVFAYAVDRDGVFEGQDELVPTDFAVIKAVKQRLLDQQ